MEQIREHLPEMLHIAGYHTLALKVDRQALANNWEQVYTTLMSTKPVTA